MDHGGWYRNLQRQFYLLVWRDQNTDNSPVHPDIKSDLRKGQTSLFLQFKGKKKTSKMVKFYLRRNHQLVLFRIYCCWFPRNLSVWPWVYFRFAFVYFQDFPRGLIILCDVSTIKKSPLALFNLFQFWLSAIWSARSTNKTKLLIGCFLNSHQNGELWLVKSIWSDYPPWVIRR